MGSFFADNDLKWLMFCDKSGLPTRGRVNMV